MNYKKILTFIMSGALWLSMSVSRVYAAEDVYEVQRGDSLWKIAERFLGDGARYTDIVSWNEELIQDPNLIYPGTQLRIMADAGLKRDTEELTDKVNNVRGETYEQKFDGTSAEPYKKGTISGTTWESEWLGMRLELPEGFEFKDAEEFFGEIDDGDEDDDSFYELGEYTDWEFVTENPAYLYSYAFLAVDQSDHSVEDYIKAMREINEELGMDIGRSEVGTAELGGQSFEHCLLVIEYTDLDLSFYQDYYITKKDNKVVVFTIFYIGDMENGTKEMTDNFSEYLGLTPQNVIEELLDGFSEYQSDVVQ